MDYKNILIPTILVGIVAGLSVYLAQQSLGWKPAVISAGITFVITICQELLKKFSSKDGSVSVKKGKGKSKAVKTFWRLFPGQ